MYGQPMNGLPYVSDVAAYVESRIDSPADLGLALGALLCDPDAYTSSRGQPSMCLRHLAHTMLLEDETLRHHLADPSEPVVRRLVEGRWLPVWREERHATGDGRPMSYKYDVCISFAGADRSIAEAIATTLATQELPRRVFYDEFERSRLWGSDLFERLVDIYSNESLFCVVLFSNDYRRKAWTQYELRAALTRTLSAGPGYVLPVAIDAGAIPEPFQSVAHWAFKRGDEIEIAAEVEDRINRWAVDHLLTLEEVTDNINAHVVAGAVVDALMAAGAERSSAGDEHASAVFRLLALVVASDTGKLTPTVRSLVDLVLFADGPVARTFDRSDQLVVIDDASLRRFAGAAGPLLLSEAGWRPIVEARFRAASPNG
jgi:hypothetical protein